MPKYETYSEKKWMERYGIWEDKVHLREENRRVENKSGRKHCGGKSIMNHLYDVQMSWWRHAKFAWWLSWKLFLLSLTAVVHGLLPFTFSSSTSDGIKKLHKHLHEE